MKRIVFSSILLFLFLYANAQSRYILNDGKEVTDGKIHSSTKRENSLRLFVWKDGDYTIYNPDEAKEYHKGKNSYYSMPIVREDTVMRRFVHKIVEGNANLYCNYSGQYNIYIVENSDTAVQLNRSTFKSGLSQVLSLCPEKSEEILADLQYDIHYIKKFVRQYNNNCRFTPLNLSRFGLLAGTNLVLSTAPDYYMPNGVGERMNFTLGAFIDEPINASDFSFHGEFFYSGIQLKKGDKIPFKEGGTKEEPDAVDTTMYNSYFKQHSMNLPLMLRYYLPTHSVRPYVNAGVQISLNFRKNTYESSIPHKESVGDPVKDIVVGDLIYSKVQPSYILGAGLAVPLNRKNILYLELRYNKLFDVVVDYYGMSKLSFLASLSI